MMYFSDISYDVLFHPTNVSLKLNFDEDILSRYVPLHEDLSPSNTSDGNHESLARSRAKNIQELAALSASTSIGMTRRAWGRTLPKPKGVEELRRGGRRGWREGVGGQWGLQLPAPDLEMMSEARVGGDTIPANTGVR